MKSWIDQLGDLDHLSIYPIISLLIFLAFFVTIIVWAVTVSRRKMEKMKNIPLEDEPQTPEDSAEDRDSDSEPSQHKQQ